MSNEHEKTEYGAAGWDTPPSEEDYTLEEILAEYGTSRQQKVLEEVEQALQPRRNPRQQRSRRANRLRPLKARRSSGKSGWRRAPLPPCGGI